MKLKQTTYIAIAATVTLVALTTSTKLVGALEKCGGVDTAIIKCTQSGTGGVENSGTWGILLLTINIMTAGIGILAVGGIVYGAILYTSAGDKAEQTKKAIEIIRNVIIGLIAYGLMYAFLQYLVPGGVFGDPPPTPQPDSTLRPV